jgi:hypothetical protein
VWYKKEEYGLRVWWFTSREPCARVVQKKAVCIVGDLILSSVFLLASSICWDSWWKLLKYLSVLEGIELNNSTAQSPSYGTHSFIASSERDDPFPCSQHPPLVLAPSQTRPIHSHSKSVSFGAPLILSQYYFIDQQLLKTIQMTIISGKAYMLM